MIAIDSISTPYGYRKRFSLSNNAHTQYLLEGIGHSAGLVEHLGQYFEGWYSLDCFSLNDTSYFPSAGKTCNIAVGVPSYQKQLLSSVFPNPFTTFTTLHFNFMVISAELNIYNNVGEKVRIVKDISGNLVEIERGSLNSGLYFYEVLKDGKNITTGKLLIVD